MNRTQAIINRGAIEILERKKESGISIFAELQICTYFLILNRNSLAMVRLAILSEVPFTEDAQIEEDTVR